MPPKSGKSSKSRNQGRRSSRNKASASNNGNKRKTTQAASPRRAWWWYLWSLFIITGCGAVLFVAGYAVYLDGIVRSQFEGVRWALPAQVYARPMDVYPGARITSEDLRGELKRLGYRAAEQLAGPGTYVDGESGISFSSRDFTFWDGHQPGRQAEVSFSGGRISQVRDLNSGQEESLMRLDPLLIGSIYPAQGEDRVLMKLDSVPPLFSAGLIAIEDRRFIKHFGVDPLSILRAAIANVRAGRVVQGGSTLTQQLVKNFFLTSRQTLWRKFTEAIMAVLLEIHYSKEEILEAYINEVYLGQDGNRAIHGFGLASYFYFHKPLAELQPHQIALLVAIVKGPSYYDPRRHEERATERRNLVLDAFAAHGFVKPEELDKYKAMPLGVGGRQGGSTTQYPAFVDLVRAQLRGQYEEADLTNEGLRIFTTLDPRTQTVAEKALSNGLTELEKKHGLKAGKLQGATVVTSTDGAEVLAVVGARKPRYAGFNRALSAKRPIGSLAKPVVFLTALAQPRRYNLLTVLEDEELELPQRDGTVWRPQNYDKRFRDEVSLHESLVRSYNLPTVRLALSVGLPQVVDTFEKLGFRRKILAVPSVSLGAVDMAPLEVAQIYNTLSTGGFYSPLLSIQSVNTKEGQPLAHFPIRLRQVMPEGPVFQLNWAMQRVVRNGTAASAYRILPKDLNLAGKTGTTDDLRDSWFAGYSGNHVAVVWVGRDDNKPARLTGSTGALQIWSKLMSGLHNESFAPTLPEDVDLLPFDITELEHDDEDCDNASFPVPFIKGTMPRDYEPCEYGRRYRQPGGSTYRPGDDDDDDDDDDRRRTDDGPLDWFWKLFQ